MILKAAKEFSREITTKGGNLKEDWLNNGPETLKDILPTGWPDHVNKSMAALAKRLDYEL